MFSLSGEEKGAYRILVQLNKLWLACSVINSSGMLSKIKSQESAAFVPPVICKQLFWTVDGGKVLGMVGFPRVVGLLEKNNQLCVVHAEDCQQLFSLGLNHGYCLCVCCACNFTCLPVHPPFRRWFDPFPVCTAEK